MEIMGQSVERNTAAAAGGAGPVDRGLEGVVACSTRISSIVGATLCYRGYTIEDLAENATYEDVVFLLWRGELPQPKEREALSVSLKSAMALSPEQIKVLSSMPFRGVHPMAWLRTGVSMLSLWDQNTQSTTETARAQVGVNLCAKVFTLVALLESLRNNRKLLPVQKDRSVAWNFLHMLLGKEPTREAARVMDACLVLHADHELNCSTFASRVVCSSLSDIYSAVTAAIGALKGPLHGGANEQVMRTLKKIPSPQDALPWLKEALARKEKIMGFGHRVYKDGDPRAKVLKGMAKTLTSQVGMEHLFQISQTIEAEMLKQKSLLPNVDFYSASVYYALGIPLDLYTPIFAAARTSGWLAHIFEQYSNNRIYRPRALWKGVEQRQVALS